MSLFIGNVSNSVKTAELESIFEEYGPCSVKIKTSYGFVDYDNERDAEEALLNCKGKIVGGQPIELEWSLRSGKLKGEQDKRKLVACYYCGNKNHKIRDCRIKISDERKRKRKGKRSRSRSKSSSLSKSMSRSRSRSRSRSKSNSESKSRSRSSRSKESLSRSLSRSQRYHKKKNNTSRSRSRSRNRSSSASNYRTKKK